MSERDHLLAQGVDVWVKISDFRCDLRNKFGWAGRLFLVDGRWLINRDSRICRDLL